jgi:hypothetical protein
MDYPLDENLPPNYMVEYAHADIHLLPEIVEIWKLAPADPTSPSEIVPTSSVLRAGQNPPPGSGQIALRYDTANLAVYGSTQRIWIEENTRLPLRIVDYVDGVVAYDQYYSYHTSTISPSSLPSNFFLTSEPPQTTSSNAANFDDVPADVMEPYASQVAEEVDVSDATAFRNSVGLETDPDLVEESLDNPEMIENSEQWGVPLTDEESSFLESADELADIGGEIENWALDDAHDQAIGGVWVSYADNEATLNVRVAAANAPGLQAQLDDASDEVENLPDELSMAVHSADTSYEDLELATEDALNLADSEGINVVETGTNVPGGVVEVGIQHPKIGDIATLEAPSDGAVEAYAVVDDPPPTRSRNVCKGRGNNAKDPFANFGSWRNGTCSPPLFGGLGIWGLSRNFEKMGSCSIGMSATRTTGITGSPVMYGILTAGHCSLGRGASWSQGENNLGRWIGGRVEGRYDYGFIRTTKRAATTRVIFNRARVERLYGVGRPSAIPVGEIVCLLAQWHRKPKCGKLFQKDHSGYVKDGSNLRKVYEWARTKMWGLRKGDSGGSVVSPSGERIWGMAGAADESEMRFPWAKHIFTSNPRYAPIVVP